MHYMTIVLQLIHGRASLHRQLQRRGQLLAAAQQYAMELKMLHQAWMSELFRTRAQSHPAQIRAEALELALAELDLPAASDGRPEVDSTPHE
jgi:hypothetical protein